MLSGPVVFTSAGFGATMRAATDSRHRMTQPSAFQHWSDYWATGALTSLPQDFAFNYDGEVAAFWSDVFSSLPNPCCVLDVCTGNGPIALMASEWAEREDRDCRILAVDAAEPNPGLIIQRQPALADLIERIEFHPATPVESLPFEADSVDLVTSQYGLEYCELESAGQSLARVLKPDGRLVMVCHGADSDMLATMQAEHADYALLEEARVFSVLRSWERGQLDELSFRQRIERIGRKLAADRKRAQAPLLAEVLNSLAELLRLPNDRLRQQRGAVTVFRSQLEAGQGRLADMLRVNRMIVDDPHWYQPLEVAGLVLERSEALRYRGEHQMGQAYHWRKV